MYVEYYVDFSILAKIAWIFVYDLLLSRKTFPCIFFGHFTLIFVEIRYANHVLAFFYSQSVNRYYHLMKTNSQGWNIAINIFVTIVCQMINKTLYKIIILSSQWCHREGILVACTYLKKYLRLKYDRQTFHK